MGRGDRIYVNCGAYIERGIDCGEHFAETDDSIVRRHLWSSPVSALKLALEPVILAYVVKNLYLNYFL